MEDSSTDLKVQSPSCCYFCDVDIDELELDILMHCSMRKTDDGKIEWACPDCSKAHCQEQHKESA